MATRFTIESVFKAIDRVSAPITRMKAGIAKFTRSVKRGFVSLGRAGQAFNKTLRGIGTRLGVMGIAAAAGSAALVTNFANAGDELAKFSARTQFGVQALQEWIFVASQSGVDSDRFKQSVQTLTRTMGNMRVETGVLFSFLQKYDEGLLAQLKTTSSSEEALKLLLARLREIEDPMEKTALAAAAFGDSGLKMINVANNSASAIENLRKESRKLGLITAEDALMSEKFNDSLDILTRSVTGIRNAIGPELLPVLTELIDKFQLWLVDSRPAIKGFFGEFAARLPGIIETIGELGRQFFAIAEDVKVFIQENEKVLKVVAVMGLAAAAIAIVAGIIASIVASVPIMIGLVAAAAIAFGTWLGDLKPVQDMFDAIFERVTNIAAGVRKFSGKVTGAFGSFFGGGDETEQRSESGLPDVRGPAERVMESTINTNSTSNVNMTIADETGRARIDMPNSIPGLTLSLADSGAP